MYTKNTRNIHWVLQAIPDQSSIAVDDLVGLFISRDCTLHYLTSIVKMLFGSDRDRSICKFANYSSVINRSSSTRKFPAASAKKLISAEAVINWVNQGIHPDDIAMQTSTIELKNPSSAGGEKSILFAKETAPTRYNNDRVRYSQQRSSYGSQSRPD
jgi:hypothetical protein